MNVWLKRCLVLVAVVFGLLVSMVLEVQFRYIRKLQADVAHTRPAPLAIVLGAAIQSNGEPSDALRDRLIVAKDLYDKHLVERLLISGDDGKFHIDEIAVMRAFLEANGVLSQDILEDGHGYRTYESCKRAKETLGIQRAIIVTQRFHIARALYLCNRLGMDATGVASDLTTYRRIVFFTARDIAASIEAWWDINVKEPKPPVGY